MPEEQVNAEDVRLVLLEVYKRQRYIVIGYQKRDVERLNLPWKTPFLFQYRMRKEFEAFEYANELDWDMQNEIIAGLRPRWARVTIRGEMYFKMRPVK